MNNIIAVLVLVVIVLVGWFAYKQGYFKGSADTGSQGIEVNLPGGGSRPSEGY